MRKKILVVSSANMDFVMNIDRIPEAGETVIDSGACEYIPGGKGANAAIALSRLGADCTFCTRIGADMNGERLAKLYASSGIDTSYIGVDRECATGVASIMIDREGQNRIIVFPGANERIPASDIVASFDSKPDALFMQFEIPYHSVITAATEADARGIPIFIDAGPANPHMKLDELPPLEVFSPNETETEIFTGIKPLGTDNCLRAAFELAKMVTAKYYVIKLGSRGAFIYDGKFSRVVPAYTMRAVDTTAAGDVFTSALTLEYLRNGRDIYAACKYANAAAGISVTRMGASSSIPTESEVRDFMQKHPLY